MPGQTPQERLRRRLLFSRPAVDPDRLLRVIRRAGPPGQTYSRLAERFARQVGLDLAINQLLKDGRIIRLPRDGRAASPGRPGANFRAADVGERGPA